MMHPAITQALAQVRIAELHRQTQRAVLGRAARRARRQPSGYPGRGILAAITAWAYRPSAVAESCNFGP